MSNGSERIPETSDAEVLREVADRLKSAANALRDLAGRAGPDSIRVRGKVEGVELALSYVNEALR